MDKIKKGILAVFVLILIWCVYHHLAVKISMDSKSGTSTYVDLDGERMHMDISGEGSHTIVLLSGYGTGSPILDFEPLRAELSKDYRVVIVENYGYGYSDLTDKERTIDNIVEETRFALKEADIKPPYILMPHSISGIYSMYYAAKYPDEVEAIIGNESSVAKFMENQVVPGVSITEKLIDTFGLTRLASIFMKNTLTPLEMNDYYDQDSLKELRRLTMINYSNKNLRDEANKYDENGKLLLSMDIERDIPMLFFIAKNDDEELSRYDKMREETLSEQNVGILFTMQGSHYLHHTKSVEMVNEIKKFINEYVSN